MTNNQPETVPGPTAQGDAVLRVSEVKRTYLGGKMSLRWWYKQIELGTLPHFRAGGTVLLRHDDVESFVAAMFRNRAEAVEPEPPAAAPVSVPKARSGRGRDGLRFFTN